MNKQKALEELNKQAQKCIACKLATTRQTVVFGEGSADAQVMFVGEGPGKQEDLTGRPFVGRAGELLTRIIEGGMKMARAEVYIANVVKCRPTVDLLKERDRPPDEDEVAQCHSFLLNQIEIIKPKVIITLGNPATKFLLNTQTGITRMRGKWGRFNDIDVMPTYHPSYVLRNERNGPGVKREVWSDIQQVLERLDN